MMDFEAIRFVRLTQDHMFPTFDCGDDDLNEFLMTDAIKYQQGLLAVTYLVQINDETIGYVSLANDKISVKDSSKAVWRKIKRSFHHSKHRGDYPAVKVGRLAVGRYYQGHDIGTKILDFIKYAFVNKNRTGCAFVTVDALRNAIPFYLKNNFKCLDISQLTSDTNTVQMYYNLTELL